MVDSGSSKHSWHNHQRSQPSRTGGELRVATWTWVFSLAIGWVWGNSNHCQKEHQQVAKESFCCCTYKSQRGGTRTEADQTKETSAIQNFVDVKRFIFLLTWLVKTIAWLWWAAMRILGGKGALNNPKWEVVSLTGVISMREREDALRDVFLATQMGVF